MTSKRAMDAAAAIVGQAHAKSWALLVPVAEALEAYAAEEREAIIKAMQNEAALHPKTYTVRTLVAIIRERGQGTGEI